MSISNIKKLESAYDMFIRDLSFIIEDNKEKVFNYIEDIENAALELYLEIERSE